jgi:hypothetical protein
MVRITDKAFRYTTSFNTDLKKKFRKLEQERRVATASSKDAEAATNYTVVPMVARRNTLKA